MLDINCANQRGAAPASLRGMFDVTTNQTVTLASITDGTSNTIAAGEGLPAQRADNNVWEWNSGANGTTVPINYPTPLIVTPPAAGARSNWAVAVCLHQHGLQEPSPRRLQLRVRRWVGPLPQAVDQHVPPTAPSAAATAARSSAPISY